MFWVRGIEKEEEGEGGRKKGRESSRQSVIEGLNDRRMARIGGYNVITGMLHTAPSGIIHSAPHRNSPQPRLLAPSLPQTPGLLQSVR